MKEHIRTMCSILNERDKRIFLASVAKELEHGGVKHVCEINGASPHTVIKGKKELNPLPPKGGRFEYAAKAA